jgi:hypothetical protein
MLATHHQNEHIDISRRSSDSYDSLIQLYSDRQRPLSSARSFDALRQTHDSHKQIKRTSSMLLTLGSDKKSGKVMQKKQTRKGSLQVHADSESSPYPLASLMDARRKQKTPTSLIRSAFGDLTNKPEAATTGRHSKRQSFSGWVHKVTSRNKKQPSKVLDQSFGALHPV